MPDILPPTSSLAAIQTKVRRLTRSMSENQLSDNDLNNYINTFVVYDFPEQLRTFNLRSQFTFYCNAFQDVYPTDTLSFVGVTDNQLYNFQNLYLTVHDPVYIAGFQAFYTQSREQFFGIYPIVNNIVQVASGDGATTVFTGIIPSQTGAFLAPNTSQTVTLLMNEVLFSSVDANGNSLALFDVPVTSTATGNPTINGNLYVPGQGPATPPTTVNSSNTVNYVTGAYTITFATPPAQGTPINAQVVPQTISMPQALLFYNNQFTLRPVPDQPYRVNFEVFQRPTALLETNAQPALEEYWQYIAYGAAKKIFEDRMDMESVQMIMPEFKTQEALCLRRSLVQWTNERVATIYTEQVAMGSGFNGWGYGGGNF